MRMGTLERIHGGFQEKRSSSVAATELSSDPESRAENWESGELGGDGAVNFQAGRGPNSGQKNPRYVPSVAQAAACNNNAINGSRLLQ